MAEFTGNPVKTLQLKPARQYHLRLSSFSSSPKESFIENLLDKVTETVRSRLRLGAKFLWPGGLLKVFEQNFSVKEGENLLKASQCYISTTSGPISGLLFISTHKIAFCSNKPIKFSSNDKFFVRFHYKVVIPVGKISSVNQRRNLKGRPQKYLEIVTVDNYDFWFLRCLSYRKTLKYLQKTSVQPY